MAVYGATVNDSTLHGVPEDRRYQVDVFKQHYCLASEDSRSTSQCKTNTSLFILWLNTNEYIYSTILIFSSLFVFSP